MQLSTRYQLFLILVLVPSLKIASNLNARFNLCFIHSNKHVLHMGSSFQKHIPCFMFAVLSNVCGGNSAQVVVRFIDLLRTSTKAPLRASTWGLGRRVGRTLVNNIDFVCLFAFIAREGTCLICRRTRYKVS